MLSVSTPFIIERTVYLDLGRYKHFNVTGTQIIVAICLTRRGIFPKVLTKALFRSGTFFKTLWIPMSLLLLRGLYAN